MNKFANLKLGGSLEHGIRVVLTIAESDSIRHEVNGSLPPNLSLKTTLDKWRLNYHSLGTTRIKVNKVTIDASLTQARLVCKQSSQELRSQFNTWLLSESFRPIRDKWLEQLMQGEVRVLIRTANFSLFNLPWQLWDLIEQNAQAEVALSTLNSEAIGKTKTPTLREKVKILAILGDSTGIDIQHDRQLLNQLIDADTTVLVEPQRREINDQLWEQHWDILFFAGHSQTEGDRGRIYINTTDSLTIAELQYALRNAVDQGLQLAIFNSCDGMGLAFELQPLRIPQTIVMREPVPDRVAQAFVTYFLPAFAEGQPLYLVERKARLRLQGLENEFPGASWLPVIVQNPAAQPPHWQDLGRRATQYCPYRGLFAFQEADAPFFYGREAFTQTLVTAVDRQSLIAVIGASGSGKSSVVFAGLLPLLRQQQCWQIASFRPGNNPLRALAVALTTPNSSHQSSGHVLTELLLTEDIVLQDVLETVINISSEQKLLLVIDQFEELYTQCQDLRSQQLFLERLLQFTQLEHCTAVITLRSDFLGQMLTNPSFADALQQGNFLLGSMNHSELQAAIERPAEQLGVTLEEGLTERMIQAVDHSASDLPVLEFALQELWTKCKDAQLTHSAYDEIGGVEVAIARYAERVYQQLTETEKAQAQRIFLQLVHLGQGTEETRRLATRTEIGDKSWNLVTRLASDRLVVTEQDAVTNTETVEIVHEALIREWTRLQQWIDQDREFRLWQQGLRAVVRQWETSDRDEGALLRGKPLTDAEDWLQKRPEELAAEQELIATSLALRDREQKQRTHQRRQAIRILTGSLVGVTFLATIAGAGWWRASSAATNDRIKALVLESQSAFDLSGAESFRLSKIENKDSQEKGNQKKTEAFQESVLKAIQAGRELQHANGVEAQTRFQVLEVLRQGIDTKAEPKAFQLSECDMLYRGPVSIAWTSDRKTIACVNYDGTVRLWDGQTGKKTNVFQGDSEWVDDVQFSPDGKMLASGTVDGTVKLWDRASGQEIRSLKGDLSQVNMIRFSSDGQRLAAANYDGTIKIWNVTTGQEITTLSGHSNSEDSNIKQILFSPNGQFLVSQGRDRLLKLWDTTTGKELKTGRLPDNGRDPEMQFSSDSQTFTYPLGALENQSIKFWSIPQNKEIRSFSVPGDPFFSPDGKVIAVIDNKSSDLNFTTNFTKNVVSLWDASTGKKLKTLTNLPGMPSKIDFSPDGSVIGVYTYDQDDSRLGADPKRKGRVTLWSRDGEELRTLEQLGELGTTFSPDSRKIAIDSEGVVEADGWHTILKLWDVSTGTLLQTLIDEPIKFSVKGLSVGLSTRFSPDGQTIAVVSSSGVARFFDSSTGKELRVPDIGHVHDLNHPAHISKDGKATITLRSDGSLVARDRATGKKLATLSRFDSTLSSAARISDDNKTIMTVTWYGKLQERELATGRILRSSDLVFDKFASSLKFSPDGRKLAAARSDYTVKLWDTNTSKEMITLKKYGRVVNEDNNWRNNELEFSPDGKIVAMLSGEDLSKNGANLELWDIATGEAIRLSGVPSGVKNISFSPNNDQLAILKTDNTIQIWELSTHQLLKTLRPRLNTLEHIQFNADSNILLAWGQGSSIYSSDKVLKLLNITTEQEVATFKLPLNRAAGWVDSANFSSDGKTLLRQEDDQVTFLDFDLENLLRQNCDIAHDYLKTSPNLSQDDKKLCDFS